MIDTKNSPLTIELPGYVVDILADWARADAKAMHPSSDQPEKKEAREKRRELGDTFARAVQHVMPSSSTEGDLADSLNERAEAYEAYRAADRLKSMKRWDVYKDGEWVDSVQAHEHSEAVIEALRKLDLDDESGLDVRLAAQ